MTLSGGARAVGLRMFVVLGAVLALIGGLSTSARAATATDAFAPSSAFGSGGGTGNPAFSSVAVGAAGKVYVTQQNFGTIDLFDGSVNPPTYLTTTGTGASGLLPLNVAVDRSNDDLYFDDNFDFGNPGIGKATSDGAPTPTYTYAPGFVVSPMLMTPGAMAVDPSNHDLLVNDDGANRVYRINETTGAVISSFDGSDTAGGAFQASRSIAVGPTGTTYVVDVATNRVEQFNAAGQSQGSLAMPAGAQPYNVAVNPVTGDVVVLLTLNNQSYLRGYAANRTFKFFARATPGVPVGGGFGLAWDGAANRIYAGTGNGNAYSFVPAKQPGVDAPAVTPDRNSAEATAAVATGGEDTTAWFEYCSASAACDSYAVSNPSDPANPWIRGPLHQNFTADAVITDDLPLNSNASWKVRTAAVNNTANLDNTSAAVSVVSPLLPPGVTTDPASALTDSEATLNGTVDTLGAQTTYHFEYGLTASYGNRVPVASESPAGSNRRPRAFSKRITGLQGGMTYHYRIVAQNSVGTSTGADQTFVTNGPSEIAPNRSYEQVTPVDKDGAQVLSDLHVNAADSGSPAIAVNAVQGPAGGVSALIRQSFVIRRNSDSWSDWVAADAPLAAANGLFEASTNGISEDFKHALVTSNRALAPGAFEGGGNLYIKNLETGTYTFVAGAPGTGAFQTLAGVQATNGVFAAGAPDFSWILFWADPSFVTGADGHALYRWSKTDGLTLESRLPDGTIPNFPLAVSGANKLRLPPASEDGSLVAFDLNKFLSGGVYIRKNGGPAIPISVSERPGDPPDAAPGWLDWVTPDGRYVFFNTPVPFQLTTDTPAPSGPDSLYRYDTVTGDLVYIAPQVSGSGSLGHYGSSDDGRTVYLDDGSKTLVWHDGATDTVTSDRLSALGLPYYMTQNGRYFAWVGSDDQAYLYDVQTGDPVCLSCTADSGAVGKAHMSPRQRSLGNTPPRTVTEDGTVFFDTQTRLVSADHNGVSDVYSYKNGRLTLITPGVTNDPASFIDVTANGSDVYFQTNQGLVSQDTDGDPDVYDAKVGGGLAGQNPAPAPAQCVRDECSEKAPGPVASSTAPSARADGPTSKKRTNDVRAKISLAKVSFGTKSIRITFTANQRGRVKVSGARVKTSYRNVTRAGTTSITVPLSAKARALRRAHKKFKVSVKVTFSGGWSTSSAKYSRTLGK